MDFSRLPNEILDKIQDYVSSRSRALLRRSCRRIDAVVRKARETKKRVYYLGLRYEKVEPIVKSTIWGSFDNFPYVFKPVILEKKCDHRLLPHDKFPKICKNTLKLDENPRRMVQQTLEKYPNVDVISVEFVIIDETFFEQFESAGVQLSQINMLHFHWCVFVVPLCSLHKWFSQIRLLCFERCSTADGNDGINWNTRSSNKHKISRFLYYGEDATSQPYDIAEWTVNGRYLSPNHAIDLIKNLIKKEDVTLGRYTLPRILVHLLTRSNARPERKVAYLAAIETFKELEESEGCSVKVDESRPAILFFFNCEYTKIVVEKLTEKGSLEFHVLIAYCFDLN